jgi:hypothetical protein
METQAILDAIMQRLVDTVADEVIRKLKAEGTATVSLEPEALQTSLIALLQDTPARDAVRDITSDMLENFDVCQTTEFQDLQREVESLQEKVEELDPAVIDADNSDFDSAVMQVLRNNI